MRKGISNCFRNSKNTFTFGNLVNKGKLCRRRETFLLYEINWPTWLLKFLFASKVHFNC